MRLNAGLMRKILPLTLHQAQVRLLISIFQVVGWPACGFCCILIYTIPPYYDSMIAKIIVHGENRFDALMKMQRALMSWKSMVSQPIVVSSWI